LIISIRDIEPVQDCDSLNVYDLESEIEKVLVPVVKDYPKSDDCFTGIYCSDLPQNSFISVNETPVMIMPTISKNTVAVLGMVSFIDVIFLLFRFFIGEILSIANR
jgi:hypothetical protein